MKKLLIVMLTLSVCVGLFANKIPAPTFDLSPTAVIIGSTTQNRDMWDVLFTFEGTPAGQPGVATDGTNIYTAKWAGGDFYRFDMDGIQLDIFTVAGASDVRDMCYDGTYFYGGAAGMTIFIMDLANETLIGTIPVSCTGVTGVRHIAFDPELDGGNGGFWVGNWGELGAITMAGAQIYANIAGNPGDLYGSAYDEWTADGPYLWLFSQGGSGNDIHQFDIATQTLTGVVHDASDIPGNTGLMAGGLDTYINDAGVFCMIAGIQQDPNLFGVYEITLTAAQTAPGAPTDVVVTPDAGGALEAVIDWICPSIDVVGDPLTDLDEMRVYRDGVLIYTDTNPTIGGAGTYDDVVPASGNYNYSVVGYNDLGEGIPASASAWIGEDIPNAVTDVVLTDVSTDELIAQLDWINPTTGYHGGYFTGVLGYDIVRSDGTPFIATGSTTTWQDDSIEDPGVYYYTITPFNSSGSGPSTTSAQVGIGVSIVQVGNGEVGDYEMPINLWYMDSMVEVVYLQEWIGTDMLINTVSFHAATTSTMTDACNLEIWMGETTETDLSAGWIDGTQLIQTFGGTLDVPPGDSWIDIPLDTAFEYTYSGNLVMMIIRDDDQYYSTSDLWWCTESGTPSRTRYDFTDNSTGWEFNALTGPWDGTGEKTIYPDVRFYWSPLEHGYVEGVIADAVTTNPIDGAEVFVGGFGPATTNALGEYLLEDVVIGTQEVTAFKDGYYDFVGSVEVLTGQVVVYDFAMVPNLFGTIDGTVTDADTGDLLVGANINAISLTGYEYDAVTDDEGYYIINDVVAETYDVSCSFPDYPTGIVEGIVIEDGIISTVDFSLEGYTYFNDFEANDGGLISSDIWDWGAFTSGPMAGYSGTNGWATSISGDYPIDSNSTLDTPMSYMIGDANAMLEFWHWYNIENGFDGGNVKISTDGGSSWNVIVPLAGYTGLANSSNPLDGEEIFCGITPDWELVQFDLSTYIGQSVMFRLHFGSDGSVQYPGWYIDDVAISGGGTPADPGTIEGTVYLDGTGNVEDVEVEAGGVIVNPADDGTYSIELQPGTYDVTATIAGYGEETITGVIVTEGNATTGVDFNLFTGSGEIVVVATKLDNNYPNPFNPETRINYSVKEAGNVTLEVYNIRGQLVKILVDHLKETGNYTIIWNGTDSSNKSVASGVYFYKMKTQNYNSIKKMILMK
jgi:hypothetical protein